MRSEPDPDDQLLRRIAAGDQEAFALLFGRHRGDVYRFALHMTASPAVADDVTQEVFLVVMREAGRFDAARASATAWLCGIARNQVRRRLDRERPLHPLEDESDAALIVAESDPLGDLTRAESIDAVREAVLTLPVRYREAVVLCDLQERTYLEAAEALGCAVGTVRSRLHRGRALLAAKLTTGSRSSESAETTDKPNDGSVLSEFGRVVRSVRNLA